jgi:hypothetical protein
MILLLQLNQFMLSNIAFLEKKVNMIMDGFFVKLSYSDESMIMNGIFIELPIITSIPSVHTFQPKNILQFDPIVNKEWIHKLSIIEKQIIQYYIFFFGISNKTSVYSLKQLLQNGSIKYYKDHATTGSTYYIKISGVWETPNEIGVTYKIIEC